MSFLAFAEKKPDIQIDGTTMDFLMNDLDDSVKAAEAEAAGLSGNVDADDGFKIESRDQAEYYTRCLTEVQRENAAVELAAKTRIEEYTQRVNDWKESKLKENAYNIDRWTALLRNWAEEQLKGSKKKSVKLIEGTLGFRKAESYEYDEKKLIPYLKANYKELLVEQDPKVDKTALKKKFNFETDKIPGVTYTRLPDTFTVK